MWDPTTSSTTTTIGFVCCPCSNDYCFVLSPASLVHLLQLEQPFRHIKFDDCEQAAVLTDNCGDRASNQAAAVTYKRKNKKWLNKRRLEVVALLGAIVSLASVVWNRNEIKSA